MPKPIGNFDSEGRLVRLHLEPKEECNLDDAEDKRALSWAEALEAAWKAITPKFTFRPTAAVCKRIDDLLCQHCMGDEE